MVHELKMDKHVKAFLKELRKVYCNDPMLRKAFRKIGFRENDPDTVAFKILETLVDAEANVDAIG